MRKWTENEEMDRECGNGKRMRKWRENEEIKRKWREYEEIERKWRKSDEMELTHHESLQSSYISKYYGHRLGMSSGQSETGIGYVEHNTKKKGHDP